MNPPVAQRVTSYEPGSKAQEGNRRIQTGQWSVSIQSRQGNKLHAPLARRGNLPWFLGLQPRLILIAPLALRRGNERCLVMHIVPALLLRPCRSLVATGPEIRKCRTVHQPGVKPIGVTRLYSEPAFLEGVLSQLPWGWARMRGAVRSKKLAPSP